MIPYGKQDISQKDIDVVLEVLKSDFLTQGPKVPEFEAALCGHAGSQYAFAMNSATSALHVACLALGLGEGDWLWTSPLTFVASANAGLYCGARVDFVDVDPKTYNMCPEKLEKKLIVAEKEKRLPKVVVPVHLSGQSCDMRPIHSICGKYGVKIIEDASHAIGGSYLGKPVGSCEFSDITVFSFHPVKIITTAEGGAALTNDSDLAERIDLYRSHGITRDENLMTEPSHGAWYYQQIALGCNYRMTDLQAALGVSQLSRLKEFVSKRNLIAERDNSMLEKLPVITPFQITGSASAFHLYIVRLQINKFRVNHRKLFDILRSQGVGVNLHYIPVHMQPFYRALGFNTGDFPEAERYYSEALSLPIFPNLSKGEQDKVVEIISSEVLVE